MVTALRAGMLEVLDVDWLRMFDYSELQTLISGTDRDIDVDDLRRHTLVTHRKA
jgi:ubiquitin-protein ligase E3 C